MSKPNINVTPLIDVLLVLLIIFMVISPLKPAAFKAKVPQTPAGETELPPDPRTLIVTVNPDRTIALNSENDFGSIDRPEKLIEKLRETFKYREANGTFRDGTNETEKTVFIKAPKTIDYGSVAKAVDAVKSAGAAPIGLQVDDLVE